MGVVPVQTSIEVQSRNRISPNGKSPVAVWATCSILCSEEAICAAGAIWDKAYWCSAGRALRTATLGCAWWNAGEFGMWCGVGPTRRWGMCSGSRNAQCMRCRSTKRRTREERHHHLMWCPSTTTTTFASRDERCNCCYQCVVAANCCGSWSHRNREVHCLSTCGRPLDILPRRILAQELCNRVRENRKFKGSDKSAGYVIAREFLKDESSKLLYCTEAVVALMLQTHLSNSPAQQTWNPRADSKFWHQQSETTAVDGVRLYHQHNGDQG